MVHLQLRVASGEPLGLSQDAIRQRGHAIEARLYAEDPANAFAPSLGTVQVWEAPHLPHVRIDSGIVAGNTITHHYDPMIAKLIAWGENREQAIRRLIHALERTVVLGVRTNLGFLIALLRHPAFQEGKLHTGLLEEYPLTGEPEELPLPVMAALGLAETLLRPRTQARPVQDGAPVADPWQTLGAWQIGGE